MATTTFPRYTPLAASTGLCNSPIGGCMLGRTSLFDERKGSIFGHLTFEHSQCKLQDALRVVAADYLTHRLGMG